MPTGAGWICLRPAARSRNEPQDGRHTGFPRHARYCALIPMYLELGKQPAFEQNWPHARYKNKCISTSPVCSLLLPARLRWQRKRKCGRSNACHDASRHGRRPAPRGRTGSGRAGPPTGNELAFDGQVGCDSKCDIDRRGYTFYLGGVSCFTGSYRGRLSTWHSHTHRKATRRHLAGAMANTIRGGVALDDSNGFARLAGSVLFRVLYHRDTCNQSLRTQALQKPAKARRVSGQPAQLHSSGGRKSHLAGLGSCSCPLIQFNTSGKSNAH